jgi:UDP-N-acetylmuramoyl-tripeptide--D-alanyl-D-alanine ligase
MDFTLAKLSTILGLPIMADAPLSGVAIDSRQVRPGDVFVALPGSKVDGHDYARAAAAAGARALLCEYRPAGMPPGFPVLIVPDSREALLRLAAAMKKEAGFRLAAVAGSAGKTTTKEFAAAILAQRFVVEKTPGNQNSAVGFPMSVVNLSRWPEWMVGEMGMSALGEVSRLSRAFEPDVAAITLIAAEHLEFLFSLDNVARANAEILEGLKTDGVFVVNGDDSRIVAMAAAHSGRTLRFGVGHEAEVGAEQLVSSESGSRFLLRTPSGSADVVLSLPGGHQVANFVAAAAVAIAAGASPDDCAAAAPTLKAAPHRGELHRHPSGAIFYDDCYNASPPSMRAALDTLRLLKGTRKIAVLGDMLELGQDALWWHQETGRYLVGRADFLVCVGQRASAIGEGANEEGLPPESVQRVESAEEAAAFLSPMLAAGDVVLFKASRGVGLERVVSTLLGRSSRRLRI